MTGGGGDRLCGDLLSLLSATLTGVSQVLVSCSLQDFHPSEYLGMTGLWGVVITSGQIFLTEQQALLSLPWHTGPVQALLLSFFLAITTYYLCLPTAIKVRTLSVSFFLAITTYYLCLPTAIKVRTLLLSFFLAFTTSYLCKPKAIKVGTLLLSFFMVRTLLLSFYLAIKI